MPFCFWDPLFLMLDCDSVGLGSHEGDMEDGGLIFEGWM